MAHGSLTQVVRWAIARWRLGALRFALAAALALRVALPVALPVARRDTGQERPFWVSQFLATVV